MTAYSSLGIVKLSRTNLVFLGFAFFSTVGGTAVAGLGVAALGAGGAFFPTAFTGAFFAGTATGLDTVVVLEVFTAADDVVAAGAGVVVETVVVIGLIGKTV